MRGTRRRAIAAAILLCAALGTVLNVGCATAGRSEAAKPEEEQKSWVERDYVKREYHVPMRDGVRLFTAVYSPRDASEKYPIMMFRTPYAVRPYGEDEYPAMLGPSRFMADEKFIFVYQDVRGCYMSEGDFVNMRPHLDYKSHNDQIDESSDTYDTVQWLIDNIPNNNGRVGQWGISYPGFYSAAGMIDAHPALIAVSPQAPIGNWYFDDFYHHGAFFLPHAFGFFSSFGIPRLEPTTERNDRFEYFTPDGYEFYMDMGPLKNANERYLHGEIPFWNDITEHPNYDWYWQERDITPHLNNVAPAVMTVGGWFDAEDLWGPLHIYQSAEQRNPDVFNILIMGPWRHGGWARDKGNRLGNIHFGGEPSLFYREHIELKFFNHFLKDKGEMDLPEAYVFETGANRWHQFDRWPPETEPASLYFRDGRSLSFESPESVDPAYDQYVSDPELPVPFSETITRGMTREYMTDDQRFASRRPDVLTYKTDVLEEDVTLAGPIVADLWCSTSGSASDWVVKLIDVFPPDMPNPEGFRPKRPLGSYQMMVRSEVLRGRFRNSYEYPEPFVPNQPTHVEFELQDVLHTFQKGHRIMVQVQSTWFPLVDRNPQKYVDNIFEADEEDFIKATQRVYRSSELPSRLRVGLLRIADP